MHNNIDSKSLKTVMFPYWKKQRIITLKNILNACLTEG